MANSRPPRADVGSCHNRTAANVLRDCATAISHVRTWSNLIAQNEKSKHNVPAYAPAGMERRREFRALKPNPEMTSGMKVETAPLQTIARHAIQNASQNLRSEKSSTTCSFFHRVFRTPELLVRSRATSTYRSRSQKDFARTGSGASRM